MIRIIQYQSLQFFNEVSFNMPFEIHEHSWGMPIGSLQLEMNEPNPHTIHLLHFFFPITGVNSDCKVLQHLGFCVLFCFGGFLNFISFEYG